MIKRLIKSRLAIAFATFALTAAMIGGATYATTSSPTDVYYACASLTGNIRASSIRLNSEPVRCSSSTDHVVQWDAAGQQIQPVAGRLIELNGGIAFERLSNSSVGASGVYTWPDIDTSNCKSLLAMVDETRSGTPAGVSLTVQYRFLNAIQGDAETFGDLGRVSAGGENYETVEGLTRSRWTYESGAIGSATSFSVSFSSGYSFSNGHPDIGGSLKVNSVSLYCTPY